METAEAACNVEVVARNSRLYFSSLVRELSNLVAISDDGRNLQPAQIGRLDELLSELQETARTGRKALYAAIHQGGSES
jgi:hypothetical protein